MNRKNIKNDYFNEYNSDSKGDSNKIKNGSLSNMDVMWPVTPIKKVSNFDLLFFINEELPEESDDEDYRPCPEDLQDLYDDEAACHSVASSASRQTLDSSTAQYLDTFDANLLIDESADQSTYDLLFKAPEENIGQRTRSKLCLSDTPLELIEKAFVPPDITVDMYDFNCDDENWENFLKEFSQPLPNNINNPDDDDEETDPDFTIKDEDELEDKEERRRDRAVKVSRKELRTLMAELFESPNKYYSDEEEEKKVRTEITNKVNSDMRKKAAGKVVVGNTEENKIPHFTKSQRLLLDQHLRQHVQLITQHFLQAFKHPKYHEYAKECKIMMATLLELEKVHRSSMLNVCNLKPAFSLMEKWEKYLLSLEGKDVIRHMANEISLELSAKKRRHRHRIKFHPKMIESICESEVFLYPLLLPKQGFRCDPYLVEFIDAEDALIAIGLEEFSEHIENNPDTYNTKEATRKLAVELLCEYLVVTKKPSQVYTHVRKARSGEKNPLAYYNKHKVSPKTVHYVVPFNEFLRKPPKEQPLFLLPPQFQHYVKNIMRTN